MQAGDFAHESSLRSGDVGQKLPRLRITSKRNKVNRVVFAKCHANLRVDLEPANAWAMSGPRIDHDIGAQGVIDGDTLRWKDFQELIVRGILLIPTVHHDFVVVNKHRRTALRLMLKKDVAPFAQGVRGEDGPLARIKPVRCPLSPQLTPQLGLLHRSCHVLTALRKCLPTLAVRLTHALCVSRCGSLQ